MRRSLGLLFVLLVLLPSSAAAHSNEVETDPANGATLETLPAEATITFSEEPKTVDVVLTTPNRRITEVAHKVVGSTITVRLPADGPRGAYTLSYRVVSADGHPVSGSVRFTVTGGPAPSTAKPSVAPTAATPTKQATRPAPARGPLVPIVIGVAILGVAATVFVARSMRR